MILVCGFIQQYSFTKVSRHVSFILLTDHVKQALSLDKAARIASMGYIQVLFGFIADYVIFQKVPEVLSVIGAFIVGIGIMYQGYAKYHEHPVCPPLRLEDPNLKNRCSPSPKSDIPRNQVPLLEDTCKVSAKVKDLRNTSLNLE